MSSLDRLGVKGHPLNDYQNRKNKEKVRIRARVEHVLGPVAQFGGDTFHRIRNRQTTRSL